MRGLIGSRRVPSVHVARRSVRPRLCRDAGSSVGASSTRCWALVHHTHRPLADGLSMAYDAPCGSS
eukprot:6970829-Prymnesium_polylepis.1